MVHFAPHHRIVAAGLIGGTENFSFGIRLKHRAAGGSDDWADTEVQAYLETIAAPAVASFFGDLRTKIGAVAKLKSVQIQSIEENGTVTGNRANPAPLHRVMVNVSGSAANASIKPWQVALAVSMHCTTEANRNARKGRFYLPLPAHDFDFFTGVIDQAQALGTATAAAEMLRALNNADAGDFGDVKVVLASGLSNQFGGNNLDVPGAINNVDEVLVGNVLDTIRSRTNGLRETFGVVPLVIP